MPARRSVTALLLTAGLAMHAALPRGASGNPWQKACAHLRMTGLALLTLLIAGPVWGQEKLVVLAEDDAASWSFKDGTGYANDLVKAAFAAAGVAVELEVVPYERGKQMVINGAGAACFSMSWLPKYEGKILFSEKPLFT